MQSVEEIRTKANEILSYAGMGASEWYKYPGLAAITSGLKEMAEVTGCFWLIDIVASYQPEVCKRYPYTQQIWTLAVVGRTGTVICTCEGGVPPIVTQNLEFTDFPLDKLVILVGSDCVACLLEEDY